MGSPTEWMPSVYCDCTDNVNSSQSPVSSSVLLVVVEVSLWAMLCFCLPHHIVSSWRTTLLSLLFSESAQLSPPEENPPDLHKSLHSMSSHPTMSIFFLSFSFFSFFFFNSPCHSGNSCLFGWMFDYCLSFSIDSAFSKTQTMTYGLSVSRYIPRAYYRVCT